MAVSVVPDGVTAGGAIATSTLCVAGLLAVGESATIEMDRGLKLVLVVEKVTEWRAVWYWAGVALPVSVSTPPEYTPVMARLLVKWSVSPG